MTQPRIQKGSPMRVIATDWMSEKRVTNEQPGICKDRKHSITLISSNRKKQKQKKANQPNNQKGLYSGEESQGRTSGTGSKTTHTHIHTHTQYL